MRSRPLIGASAVAAMAIALAACPDRTEPPPPPPPPPATTPPPAPPPAAFPADSPMVDTLPRGVDTPGAPGAPGTPGRP